MTIKDIKKYDIEHRKLRPDGKAIWVHAQAELERDEEGLPRKLLGTIVDIASRKRAEEDLKKSERYYRTIIKTALDGFFINDMDGRIIDVNDSYCKMIGYSNEELLRMSISDVEAVEKPAEIAEHIQNILTNGYDRFKTKHRRKDGKIIDIEVSATGSKEGGGQLVVFLRDITERKQAEEKIQKQSKFLKNLLEAITHPVYVIDANDYTIKLANTAAHLGDLSKNLTCYALTHKSNKPCSGREHPCPLKIIKKTKKTEVAEHVHYDKNGNTRNIEVHGFPVFDNKGRLIQVIEYALDITERKQSEDEIKQQHRMFRKFSRKTLFAREEEKKKLSANLHDEIGAMAIALNSALSLVEKNIKDDNSKNAIENIYKSEHLLKESVGTLKKTCHDLRPPHLNIIGFPDTLREYFSTITEKTKIKINFSSKIGKKKLDDTTAIVLYRVSQEAFNNIIKHANAKNVKIRLYSQKNNLKFNIHDDGKGFDVKRLGEIKTPRMGVFGMKERVESLRGVFILESKPKVKKGTKISITLPNMGGSWA